MASTKTPKIDTFVPCAHCERPTRLSSWYCRIDDEQYCTECWHWVREPPAKWSILDYIEDDHEPRPATITSFCMQQGKTSAHS